jgi:aminoglycoside phosphotransferase (APT) family kinase protein
MPAAAHCTAASSVVRLRSTCGRSSFAVSVPAGPPKESWVHIYLLHMFLLDSVHDSPVAYLPSLTICLSLTLPAKNGMSCVDARICCLAGSSFLEHRLRASLSSCGSRHDVDLIITGCERRPFSTIFDAQLLVPAESPRDVVIKVYRTSPSRPRERVRSWVTREYDILSTLAIASSMPSQPPVAVVEPLACLPDDLAIVTARAAGESFQTVLREHARYFSDLAARSRLRMLAFRCGEWLRAFQRVTHQPDDGPFDVSTLIEQIDQLMIRASAPSPFRLSSTLACQIRSYCTAALGTLATRELAVAGVHGDFFPGNILADGYDVRVLDFEMFRYGSVWFDVTYFIHQLRTLLFTPTFSPAVISAVEYSFLAGFTPSHVATRQRANRLFAMFLILHVLRRLVSFAEHHEMRVVRRLQAMRIARRHLRFLASATAP